MATPKKIEIDGVEVVLVGKCPTFSMCGDKSRIYHVTIFTGTSKDRKGNIVFHITHLHEENRSGDEHYFFTTYKEPETPDNPCGIAGVNPPEAGKRNHNLEDLKKYDDLALSFLKKNWSEIYKLI